MPSAICLNFGLAKEFGGMCNLRFDDTNPAKEDQEYMDGDPGRRAAGWALTGPGELHYASRLLRLMLPGRA